MTAVPETTATSLQQAIFNAPPGAAIPPPSAAGKVEAVNGGKEDAPVGVKRAREESDEEEQPMEEESDVEMEASSDESE